MLRYFPLLCEILRYVLVFSPSWFQVRLQRCYRRYCKTFFPLFSAILRSVLLFSPGCFQSGYKGASFRYAEIFPAILCYVALRCAVFFLVVLMLGVRCYVSLSSDISRQSLQYCGTLCWSFLSGLKLGNKVDTLRYAHIFSAILCYVALRAVVLFCVFLGQVIGVLRCVMLIYFPLFSAMLRHVLVFSSGCFQVRLQKCNVALS